jgi:C4-dicarboxylate transporter, DctM subunit
MVVLPLAEIGLRRAFGIGIPGSGPFVQHLTLWVGFLGAAIAARENKLLALATGTLMPDGAARRAAQLFAYAVAAAISTVLFFAAVELVRSYREAGTIVAAGVPAWVTQLVLPVAFALIAVRLIRHAVPAPAGRALAATGIVAGLVLALSPELLDGRTVWPYLAVLVLAAVLGAPIFAVLGGAGVLLFLAEGITPAAILIETYALSVSPTLPAIPLFTLAGFLLAEGRASERLLRVFRAWFGWLPGGTAIVCAVLCAFFTVFTGGSGVTILALGGLLFPALIKEGYRERFSLGLLTASGSLGLLLPPALPLILYGIVAQTSIEDLFIGGILPGLLLIGLISAWGVREGLITGAGRARFSAREALVSLWGAKWELLLPAVVLTAIFGGFATMVEAAALTALYAFVVQWAIHRDVRLRANFLPVMTECVMLVGGVLIILGVAVGFMNYLVTVEVPAQLLDWTQAQIESPLAFLLALNLFLLAIGCFMDIFSATIVVVPLIVPLGLAYDIHPVHLGIIFIANLELGYLTPPVGMNLFLASYRFKRPLLEVWRASLPMLLILGLGVLVITYVPWLTLGILRLLGRL